MCKAMEDMRNEAAREADKARTVKIARRMLNSGKYTCVLGEILPMCWKSALMKSRL